MTFKFDSECLYLVEIVLYDAVDVVNTFIKSRTCVKQGIHFFAQISLLYMGGLNHILNGEAQIHKLSIQMEMKL